MTDLSLIIPAYNAQAFIAGNLAMLDGFLRERFKNYEIIVVDDGSKDKTAQEVMHSGVRRAKVISLPRNVGKFGALKTGMSVARGRVRIFTDADIPFDLEAIPYMFELINERDFHVVIGDRTLSQSRYALENSRLRRFMTYGFSTLVRLIVTGQLADTQCGLKGFRGDVADALFPIVRADGFAGDVELLYVALKYNLELKRIPVRMQRSAPTSVRLSSHCIGMVANIAQLKIRWTQGQYYSPDLLRIGDQSYWDAKAPTISTRSTGT